MNINYTTAGLLQDNWAEQRRQESDRVNTSHSNSHMDKYDRQIRLWSTAGQHALAQARVAFVGSLSAATTEILKNLVLPGIGKVVIIENDDAQSGSTTTTTTDDNHSSAANFFIDNEGIPEGTTRAQCIIRNISLMNPDVVIEIEDDRHIQSKVWWNQFNCVICAGTCDADLANILWGLDVPLVCVQSVGFYAYLRIQMREHTIVDTHEPNLIDLRLDRPWKELQELADSIDLNATEGDAFQGIPYSLLLTKLIREPDLNLKSTSELRNHIKSLYKTGDEENLNEAYAKAYMIMKDSSTLSEHVKHILNDKRTDNITPESSPFWILCNALKQFYEMHGVPPLSGVLPDMHSDTAEYIKLKQLYTDKYNADKEKIKQYADHIRNDIPDNLLTQFVKNCRFLKVIDGTKMDQNEDIQRALDMIDDFSSTSNKNVVLLALKLYEQFIKEHSRAPSPNPKDRSLLRTLAISILCKHLSSKAFPQDLDKVLDEICRYSGQELHSTSALIGGVTAQEVVKIVTGQYVTVDNTFLFDGVTGSGAVFKL